MNINYNVTGSERKWLFHIKIPSRVITRGWDQFFYSSKQASVRSPIMFFFSVKDVLQFSGS